MRVVRFDSLDGAANPSVEPSDFTVPPQFNNALVLVFDKGPTVPEALLIPAAEVFRYFYCAKAKFIRSIFDGALFSTRAIPKHAYAAAGFDGVRFRSVVRFPALKAPDEYAWREARAITLRAAASYQREGVYVIEAMLPTKAFLDVEVCGLRLRRSAAFLVFQIVSARMALPSAR